jgi:hypothetical protein
LSLSGAEKASIRQLFSEKAKEINRAETEHKPSAAALSFASTNPREIARSTQTVNYLLKHGRCPESVRPLIDCLLGLADGADTWIELSDADVVAILFKDEKTKKATLHARVRRWRRRLIEIQTECKVTFIQVEPGGKKKGVEIKSKYRLFIYAMIEEVQQLCLDDPGFDADPDGAIERACDQCIKAELALIQKPPKVDKLKRALVTPETLIKTAITLMWKACDMCASANLARGRNELAEPLPMINAQPVFQPLVEETEKAISYLYEMGAWRSPEPDAE